MFKRLRSCLLLILLCLLPTQVRAWNNFGHRLISSIAFRELKPEARAKIVALLREHPAAKDPVFWKSHAFNSPDEDLNLFMNAALFPDDARSEGPFHAYHISRAHYVNWRLRADQDGRVDDPIQDLEDDDPHGDALESLAHNVSVVQDPAAASESRAVALSWIFHQLQDLHQPLHTVSRFTPSLPGGDRGGNQVRVPGGNLHGYWDGLLGRNEQPLTVDLATKELIAEFPRSQFEAELQRPTLDFRGIGFEGFTLAQQVAYRNLDPAFNEFPELPIGYAADARKTARRQAVLAGYRLADLLEMLAEGLPNAPATPN